MNLTTLCTHVYVQLSGGIYALKCRESSLQQAAICGLPQMARVLGEAGADGVAGEHRHVEDEHRLGRHGQIAGNVGRQQRELDSRGPRRLPDMRHFYENRRRFDP